MKKQIISMVLILFCVLCIYSDNDFVDFNELLDIDITNKFPLTSQYNRAIRTIDSFFTAERILMGNIELLDKVISDFSLAQLQKNELRVLRNMIYARYNYRFQSEDLTQIFKMLFSWYRGDVAHVDEKLTDCDKKNIAAIKFYEGMSETKNDLVYPKQLIGVWQDIPVMASGWSNRFVFYENGDVEYLTDQMQSTKIFLGFKGKYYIKGNTMRMEISTIYFYKRNTLKLEYDVIFGGYGWKDSKVSSLTLKDPIILNFPITTVEERSVYYEHFEEYFDRVCLNIGTETYFLMRENVNARY